MPDRVGLAGGQQRRGQRRLDIAIFGVDHDDHAVVGRDAHGVEERGVIDHEDIFVSHEELQAGDAFVEHGGDFFHHGVVEVGDGHVKGVVDLGDIARFRPPGLQPVMQAAADGLDDEVDMGGRAAESRRHVPDIKVVVADRAAEGQVEVGVHIDAAGHAGICRRSRRHREPRRLRFVPDQRDDFAVDQHIGLHHVAGGDDRTVFEYCAHCILLLQRLSSVKICAMRYSAAARSHLARLLGLERNTGINLR